MFTKLLSFVLCLTVAIHAVYGNDEKRKATAFLLGSFNNVEVRGKIIFAETDNGLYVSGRINGMPPGQYGFHIHEAGDISDCDLTLGHFDTAGMVHGGQHHEVRHVGDLGNVIFDANREGIVDFTDPLMALRGYNSILGRALVLHELEDDLGKVGDEGSLLTGNAGPRVACGVVGILEPIAPWNSAASLVPSFLLLISVIIAFLVNM